MWLIYAQGLVPGEMMDHCRHLQNFNKPLPKDFIIIVLITVCLRISAMCYYICVKIAKLLQGSLDAKSLQII